MHFAITVTNCNKTVAFCNKVAVAYCNNLSYFVIKYHNETNSVMVILCPMSLGHSFLKGRCTSVALPRRKLQNGLEFLLEFWPLLKKLPKKRFGTLKFKIWIIYDLITLQFFVWCCMVDHNSQFFWIFFIFFCFYLFVQFFVRFFILFDYYSFNFFVCNCLNLIFSFFKKILIKKKKKHGLWLSFLNLPVHEIHEYTGFHWLVFSHIRTEL